ncbi:uncharacterized protein LOC141623420 isoform X2 [Silene latifolia]|uniref:uncharacterized protein LOC141623420 isoform X2 n=1 Tax=Silene latifolia TaxID=37657 RepID=UPI003D780CC9
MKDILTKKKSIRKLETIAFTKVSSAILQGSSPPKLKDPGSFSIPCTIGNTTINKALCDLGASMSVMPYSVSKRLGMGELKCTNITLQMADRSTKTPLGIWEDVPVRIGKFFIPVDFVIVDMEEDSNIPIILGRPFLHTAGAVIDVKHGELTLEVGDESITFNLDKTMRAPRLHEPCFMIDHYSRKDDRKKSELQWKNKIEDAPFKEQVNCNKESLQISPKSSNEEDGLIGQDKIMGELSLSTQEIFSDQVDEVFGLWDDEFEGIFNPYIGNAIDQDRQQGQRSIEELYHDNEQAFDYFFKVLSNINNTLDMPP